jgi:hypothetical protein
MQTQKQLEARMNMERRLVRRLIRTAKVHGYAPVWVDDGEEMQRLTTERAAMDAVFAVDESRMGFKHPEEPKSHCAVIVLGNSGWDAIADSSMGGKWDAVMAEMDAYSDKLCEEVA